MQRNLSDDIYSIIEYAFSKGVVCGIEAFGGKNTHVERFREVIEFAYDHFPDEHQYRDCALCTEDDMK